MAQRVVFAHRTEDRPGQVFVQIAPADARSRDLDLDVTGGDLRFVDVFDADVLGSVPACSFHVISLHFSVLPWRIAQAADRGSAGPDNGPLRVVGSWFATATPVASSTGPDEGNCLANEATWWFETTGHTVASTTTSCPFS